MEEFIEKWGLYIAECDEWTDYEPSTSDLNSWSENSSHWKLKIKSTVFKGKYKTEFHMGKDHVGKPELCDLLGSIASDCIYDDDFNCFCDNFGCSKDSIQALELFNRMKEYHRKMQKFLGPAALEELMQIEY